LGKGKGFCLSSFVVNKKKKGKEGRNKGFPKKGRKKRQEKVLKRVTGKETSKKEKNHMKGKKFRKKENKKNPPCRGNLPEGKEWWEKREVAPHKLNVGVGNGSQEK